MSKRVKKARFLSFFKLLVVFFFRFSSFDEENVQFCCENIAAHVEHTLEWEREMVIKRQQEVLLISPSFKYTEL